MTKKNETEKPEDYSEADELLSKLAGDTTPADILIVDDIFANLFLIENILNEEFTVKSVNCAADMWAYLRERTPRIILLDLMMPFENGFEILQKMKSKDMLKKTPVIVVSAKDTKDDVIKAMQLGAVDYIVKPVEEISLIMKIKKALNIPYEPVM